MITELYRSRELSECNCPQPCHRTIFNPSISYAGTSDFDAQLFLRNVNKTILSENYMYARDIHAIAVTELRYTHSAIIHTRLYYIL